MCMGNRAFSCTNKRGTPIPAMHCAKAQKAFTARDHPGLRSIIPCSSTNNGIAFYGGSLPKHPVRDIRPSGANHGVRDLGHRVVNVTHSTTFLC